MSEGNGQSRKKVACLGLPSYGSMTPGAALGFYRAASGRHVAVRGKRVTPEDLPSDMQLHFADSSLLATNMNILWAWALNRLHRGQPVDYFSMIHSDIEPEQFWLDALVAEMVEQDLDVLGVVAPIKDRRGVTSTAIARPDGDPWRVKCRLTMREVYQLPETFTSRDVGGELLINTGLWVCRFREEWARQCHFTVNDRIRFDVARDLYTVETEPEDWFVSRRFHALGLKVGCTRKVKLGHRGQMVFGNERPWGEHDFDREYLTEPAFAPPPPPDGWHFPHEVDGWLDESEGRELARIAAGKDVVEFGSFCGRSTICLAHAARTVEAIDTFDGRDTPRPGPTLEKFRANLLRHRGKAHVGIHEGTVAERAPRLPAESYDLVFVDGAHDEQSVRADIGHALRLLRPGGLIALHDYGSPAHPGVKAAVDDELLGPMGGELLSLTGTLAVVRPPAFVPNVPSPV